MAWLNGVDSGAAAVSGSAKTVPAASTVDALSMPRLESLPSPMFASRMRGTMIISSASQDFLSPSTGSLEGNQLISASLFRGCFRVAYLDPNGLIDAAPGAHR